MADKEQKILPSVLSVDYSNEEELTEDTQLMYEKFKDKIDESVDRKPKHSVEFDASMDVCIFMRDRSGIHVKLEEGHNAEAADLFDIVKTNQSLPPECENIFALWLVSPLLELRLKKKHKPYFMVQQWDELCSKYTDAKATAISEDEPVLMLQRNVFFPKEQEVNITNEKILSLLYHEAKYNVLEGRYIINPDEYHTLAGIQSLLTMGKYDERNHLIQIYRTSLYQYYPEHIYRKQTAGLFSMMKSKEPKNIIEERWMTSHKQLSKEYDCEDIDKIKATLYKKYLEILWPYPFYGAAFFDSFINKPQGKLSFLKRSQDIETWTAINTNGVCIIDRDKDEVLLAVPFTECRWEYGEPHFDIDNETFPCIYLQFLLKDSVEGDVTKVLQVYSRQSKMMIALIETCVSRKKMATDDIDGIIGEGNEKSVSRERSMQLGNPPTGETDAFIRGNEFHERCSNKLSKMCLSTFSTTGECLD